MVNKEANTNPKNHHLTLFDTPPFTTSDLKGVLREILILLAKYFLTNRPTYVDLSHRCRTQPELARGTDFGRSLFEPDSIVPVVDKSRKDYSEPVSKQL